MKRLIVFVLGGLCVLSGLAGCRTGSMSATEVQQDNGEFPPFLVGVWKATFGKHKWGIKFESDGSISKIIHNVVGPVKLSEGGVFLEGPEEDTYAIFSMGPCEANYIPAGRMLKVKIVLDHYQMKLPAGDLIGRIEDYMEGPVLQDGKTWEVKWRSYGWLDGATPPDIALIDANPDTLIFTKLDLGKLQGGG